MDPFFALLQLREAKVGYEASLALEQLVPGKPVFPPKWRVFYLARKGDLIRRGEAYGWTLEEARDWYSTHRWSYWMRKYGYPKDSLIRLELIKREDQNTVIGVTNGLARTCQSNHYKLNT